MGWRRFTAWLGVMQRQLEPPETSPGSWKGTENDAWWEQARRERDALRTG